MTTSRQPVRTRVATLAVATLTLATLACGGSQDPVDLSGTWPQKAGSYRQVNEDWTRRGVLRGGLDDQASQILELHATLQSPQWRAAYIERAVRLRRLDATGRRQLEEEQRKASEEAVEVTLVVTTYDRAYNDLQKGKRSVWRVAIGSGESQVVADSIKRDRRPLDILRAEYPWVGDFSKVYVARFPPGTALGSGASEVELVMSSHLGHVDLVWEGR